MPRWSPQLFRKQALEAGVDETVVANALAVAGRVAAVDPNLPAVFTLNHLAHLTGVEYGLLRAMASRANLDPYRVFRIRKRPSHLGEVRFRIIAVPNPGLLKVQRWITQAILSKAKPHAASVAYSKGDTLLAAVEPHCGARWLIKLDVRSFFESISEVAAYRVFTSLGYQPLISLEMARLCTRLGGFTMRRAHEQWRVKSWTWTTIAAYTVWRPDRGPRLGHLPQGAPTSPMLANLASREFDGLVDEVARKHGLTYTRYADDLALSTRDEAFSRVQCSKVLGEVYAAMGKAGFSPNATKTRVSSPGSRKIVLGLLVDGPKPRLPREFKTQMRQHIHFVTRADVGPISHARARGFASVTGFRHHLQGLVSFALQVEPSYGAVCASALSGVDWPL
jgi:hypothetical protein